jgi:hypothetical protein
MADKPVLLSGGNPQIPKGYGQGPIDAYIAAMPGWKSPVGRKIDEIVSEIVPGVMKAVKWNSPMYGTERDHFFLSLHCFDKYIKIAFHKGVALDPEPPVTSRQKEVRYYHVFEDGLDEAQFADWVRQASELPGEKM